MNAETNAALEDRREGAKALVAGPAERALSGSLRVPGDKSISHRSVMLAALADGETEVTGFLPGEDNLATAAMFEAMGVEIDWLNEARTRLRVRGVGLHGLREPEQVLDAGNSGTCARLMAGVLAGQDFFSVLVGDASLHRRPMRRVADPLRRMGARIDGRDGGNRLPLAIRGGGLRAIRHAPEVASAQVKSCVLLAGLFAEGETCVIEPRPTRDHTERMLPLFGQPVAIGEDGEIRLAPAGALRAPEAPLAVPADPSSACFVAIAASLVEGSEVRLLEVGVNPRRDGWRRILAAMGGALSAQAASDEDARLEPVCDIEVRHAPLAGVCVDPADVPDAIDEFPALFVAASLARGRFELRGAKELRVKESDRIAAMARALSACGAKIEERPDGVVIEGAPRLRGGATIDAHGDHRIAMAMAVAAQAAEREIRILGAETIATSFPDFVPMARSLGMNVRWEDA